MRSPYSGSQKHEVCQILRGSAFRTEAVFTSRNLRKPIGTCDSQLPITNYQLPITNYPLPITGHTSPLRERLYSSLASLPLRSLRSLRLNHSNPTEAEICALKGFHLDYQLTAMLAS